MLFLIALAVAIVGRIGLAVMDLTGTLSYDSISAADVPILDVVCSILTGSALVAFMYAASLAMVVSTAGVALHGLLSVSYTHLDVYKRQRTRRSAPG